jgi:hypothetical protein
MIDVERAKAFGGARVVVQLATIGMERVLVLRDRARLKYRVALGLTACDVRVEHSVLDRARRKNARRFSTTPDDDDE